MLVLVLAEISLVLFCFTCVHCVSTLVIHPGGRLNEVIRCARAPVPGKLLGRDVSE